MERESEVALSIVIPNYGAKSDLFPLLQSIPDRDDLEVFVVDDCSPDWDRKGEEPTDIPSRTIFVRQAENVGAGACRNVGLERANGTWVMFADSDDRFSEDGICNAMSCAEKVDGEVDLIFFSPKAHFSDGSVSERARKYQKRFSDYLQTGDDYDLRRRWYPPWAKMFRRSMIDAYGIRFDETRVSNDVCFSVKTGLAARKIFADEHDVYHVCERPGSLTSTKTLSNRTTRLEVHIRYLSYLLTNDRYFDPLRADIPILAPWKILFERRDWLGVRLFSRTVKIYVAIGARLVKNAIFSRRPSEM